MRNLETVLNDLLRLLDRCNEEFWYEKVRTALKDESVPRVAKVRDFFGGGGSLNDLVLSRFNDHSVTQAEEVELNEQLDRLRSEIFELVS